jgi:hypothetical protein
LLELIQDVASGNLRRDEVGGGPAKKFPPAAAGLPLPRAVSAAAGAHGSNDSHVAQASGGVGPAQVIIPFGDHHSEQEDYLWGV